MPGGAALRVHHVIDSLTWGGAEMLLADLASAADGVGIEMSVSFLVDVDGSPAASRLRRTGVVPVHIPAGRVLDPAGLMRVRRHLARIRPDVVHTHLDAADTLAAPAARSLGVPAVSTVHMLASGSHGLPGRDDMRVRLAATVRRRIASRVITVSDAARDAYLAADLDRRDHMVTVHNGVVDNARTDGFRVRDELGLDLDAVVVTTVTVLRPGKGHLVALEAVARLRAEIPALRLVVLGDGPAREQIARAASPLGETVVMAGHRDDVPSVLAASDIVLHATEIDAFPTALLEAGAAAVPVIATRVGGIPEIVTDGETGLLIPAPPTAEDVAGALRRLCASAATRERLGAAARERFAREFTAARWAERLRTVYDEVREPARSRHPRRPPAA